jgi:hypothetical protein
MLALVVERRRELRSAWLGKPTLYQLSYARASPSLAPIEPAGFGLRVAGHNERMTAAFVIVAVIAIASTVVYLGLLVWGAIEDGRDQDRRDRERLPGQ